MFKGLLLTQLLITLKLCSCLKGLTQYFESTPQQNITIPEGASVNLPCVVRNLQGYCIWQKNSKLQSVNKPQSGDCSYLITRASLKEHDGVWDCQVSPASPDGVALSSRPVRVTVLVRPERPQIKREPAYAPKFDITANVTNEIICNVLKGNPPPIINWFLDNINITDKSIVSTSVIDENDKSILVTSHLRMSFTRDDNNHNLTCRALHPTGDQFDSVKLDVHYVPILSVDQSVYSVKEGSDLKIECHVQANPKVTAYWKRKNGDIVNSVEPNVLYFSKIMRTENDLEYECHAQNDKGAAKPVSVKIDVLYPPRSLNTSSEQSLKVGMSTRLSCYFEGNPKPKIEWYLIDPRFDNKYLLKNLLNDDQVVEIINSTYSDEGEYYCQAFNSINGEVMLARSPRMILDVYGPPEFTSKSPITIEGSRGRQNKITVWFCSDPPPDRVFWQFGSIQLDVRHSDLNKIESYNQMDKLNQLRYKVEPLSQIQTKRQSLKFYKCYEASLLIEDAEMGDERDYTLFVHNNMGTEQAVVKFKVVTPLPVGVILATALAILIITCLLSMIILLIIKCHTHRKDKVADEEAKEDAQAFSQIMNPNNTEPIKAEPQKPGSENHELVYANLDFPKDNKPQTRPKPILHQRSNMRTGTEYAKLSFSNKADL